MGKHPQTIEEVLKDLEYYLELGRRNTEADMAEAGLIIPIDGVMSARRIYSRILACGNLVAMKGRLGPANFVIINNDWGVTVGPADGKPTHSPRGHKKHRSDILTSSGMEVFRTERIGDEVLVGRLQGDAAKFASLGLNINPDKFFYTFKIEI